MKIILANIVIVTTASLCGSMALAKRCDMTFAQQAQFDFMGLAPARTVREDRSFKAAKRLFDKDPIANAEQVVKLLKNEAYRRDANAETLLLVSRAFANIKAEGEFRTRNRLQAIQLGVRALDAGAEPLPTLHHLMRVAHTMTSNTRLIHFVKEAQKINPNDGLANLMEANLIAKDNPRAALKIAEKVARDPFDLVPALKLMADISFRSFDQTKAWSETLRILDNIEKDLAPNDFYNRKWVALAKIDVFAAADKPQFLVNQINEYHHLLKENGKTAGPAVFDQQIVALLKMGDINLAEQYLARSPLAQIESVNNYFTASILAARGQFREADNILTNQQVHPSNDLGLPPKQISKVVTAIANMKSKVAFGVGDVARAQEFYQSLLTNGELNNIDHRFNADLITESYYGATSHKLDQKLWWAGHYRF